MSLKFDINLKTDELEKSEAEDHGIYPVLTRSEVERRYSNLLRPGRIFVLEGEVFNCKYEFPGLKYNQDIDPDENVTVYTAEVLKWLMQTVQYELISDDRQRLMPALARRTASVAVAYHLRNQQTKRVKFTIDFDACRTQRFLSTAKMIPPGRLVDISKCTYRPNK
ncbi:hypothetical protein [Vibrio phage BONAISHI]|nr:hypothetical protein [Vibrio phage BONAISHI]